MNTPIPLYRVVTYGEYLQICRRCGRTTSAFTRITNGYIQCDLCWTLQAPMIHEYMEPYHRSNDADLIQVYDGLIDISIEDLVARKSIRDFKKTLVLCKL